MKKTLKKTLNKGMCALIASFLAVHAKIRARCIIGLCMCITGINAMAGEIAYTGGGRNGVLTDPANWETGEFPSSEDVGIVDLSKIEGGSVRLGSNLVVKGLKFINGGSKSIYLGSEGSTVPSLTLGESGLQVDSAWLCQVQINVVIASAQTWSMGNAELILRSPATVSGTFDWTISGFRKVSNMIALNYGGKIIYSQQYNPVWNMAAGRWAEYVAFSGTGGQYERPVLSLSQGSTSVSEMFGNRYMNFNAGPAMLDFGDYGHAGQYATFRVEALDTVSMSNYSTLSGGDMQIAGGTLQPGTYFDLGVYQNVFGTQVSHDKDTRLLVSDGSLDPVYLGVGRMCMAYKDGGSTKRIVQTGGTVGSSARSYAFLVGGGLSTTPGTYPEPIAEYCLGGGEMNFPNANQSEHGLVLSCNNDTSTGTVVGVFTQTGGVARVGEVQFGARQDGHWGSVENAKPNCDGFGLLDLAGGTFELGANGFKLAPKWNVGGSESNAAYKVRLRGGKIVSNSNQTNELAMDVTGNEESTIEVAAGCAFVQTAPLRGSGTLRKKGEGSLVLRDATHFTGKLSVDEGRVVVEGREADIGGTPLVWTADSIATGKDDGTVVPEWADTTGQYVAGGNSKTGYTALPTVKQGAFNGHAGLNFSYDKDSNTSSSLAFAAGDNVLCGLTNFTVVVVARPSKDETTADDQGSSGTTWTWCDSILGNNFDTDGCFLLQYTKDGATAGCFVGSEKPRCAVESDMKKDVVSVIIASRRGNEFEINVNGVVSNHVNETFSGDIKCWRDTKKPLYIACNANQSGGVYNRGFKGDIAEIRIYPDCVLSAIEKESLMLSLMDKYEPDARRLATIHGLRFQPTADEFYEMGDAVAPEGGLSLDAAALSELDAPDGSSKPEFVNDALAGRPVVRFNGSSALEIPANTSQLNGQEAFSAAVVFRATEKGVDGNIYAGGLGLLSSKQADAEASDFVLSWRDEGSIGAGYGSTSGSATLFSYKPCRLDDGEGHVAVFVADPHNGVMRMMVDGLLVVRPLSAKEARGNYPVCVGALRPGEGYFKGDIAAVRLYGSALSVDEMNALSEYWAQEYRLGLMGKTYYGVSSLKSRGIAARSIEVANGAVLVVPDSESGFAVSNGKSISCYGTVAGNTILQGGAVIDVDWNDLPASLGKVTASGVVTVRVNNAPTLPKDVPVSVDLVKIDELNAAQDVEWRVEGVPNVKPPYWDPTGNILRAKRLLGLTMTIY